MHLQYMSRREVIKIISLSNPCLNTMQWTCLPSSIVPSLPQPLTTADRRNSVILNPALWNWWNVNKAWRICPCVIKEVILLEYDKFFQSMSPTIWRFSVFAEVTLVVLSFFNYKKNLKKFFFSLFYYLQSRNITTNAATKAWSSDPGNMVSRNLFLLA